jgi:hypothetical protein
MGVAKTTKTVFLESQVQNPALINMIQKAKEFGLDKGVAFVAIKGKKDRFPRVAFTVLQLERDPDPEKGENDTGTNYFGVAMAKLAVMLSTGRSSGPPEVRPLKTGEVAYQGGIVLNPDGDCEIYTGFSGGTERQDLEIAIVGGKTLIKGYYLAP